MKNIQIEDGWQYYLKRLQVKYPSAIIAGGALRDLYTNNTIKDIDMFVDIGDNITNTISKELCEIFEIENHTNELKWVTATVYIRESTPPVPTLFSDPIHFDANIHQQYDYAVRTKIAKVAEINKEGFLPFQVIFCEVDPIKYVNDYFDIGICKAYYDGKVTRFTPDFLTDVANETITICGKMNRHELFNCITKHIPRIRHKFPNHTIVVDIDKLTNKNNQEQPGAKIC